MNSNYPSYSREASTPLLPMMTSSETAFDHMSIADLCQQMQEMKLRVSKLEEMEMRMEEMQQQIDELRSNCTCESGRSPKRPKGPGRSQRSKRIIKGSKDLRIFKQHLLNTFLCRQILGCCYEYLQERISG